MKRMMAGHKYFWRFASFKMGWLESSYFQRGSHLSMMTNDDADADDDEDVAKRSLALVHPDFFLHLRLNMYIYIYVYVHICVYTFTDWSNIVSEACRRSSWQMP